MSKKITLFIFSILLIKNQPIISIYVKYVSLSRVFR